MVMYILVVQKKKQNEFPVPCDSSTLPVELQELYNQMSYYDYGNK